MPRGWALPLALAVLSGIGLGANPPPALAEGLGLLLLVALAMRCRAAAVGALLVAWMAGAVLMVEDGQLAPGLGGVDLTLEGRLDSVAAQGRLTRLVVSVEHCRPLDPERLPCRTLRRVRLNAYAPPPMVAGERWRLTVRLRPPGGLVNPGTFDYRAWLWREGIQATGYVRDAPPPRRLGVAPADPRRWALALLDDQDLPPRAARWLAALTLGASQRLTDDDWALLNASGTTHLMVISGLHVSLVAAVVLLLGRGLARLAMPTRWRLAVWPWWLAALGAGGYALLAGLEPPALRALTMTLVGLWVSSGRHAPGPWQGWWLALALVLLLDPLSAWRPGLWLSFSAVAMLILIWQGRPRPRGVRGWLWGLVRTQLLLAPGMAAAVLLAFDRLAPAAPLVNLVAVPLVSGLLVPLGLLGWLLAPLPGAMGACWWLFARLAEGLAGGLEAVVAWLPLWHPEPSLALPVALSLLVLAALWGLPGLDGRLRVTASLVLCLVPLLWQPPRVPPGELRVRIHDVGQGQLVELRTAGYRLLYDTGPRFGSGFTPLETLWPPGQAFDMVIVSHADGDHAGGVAALDARHRVERYIGPSTVLPGERGEPCRAGRHWRRDGVDFRLLWPPRTIHGLSDNDRSCVMEVTAGRHRLLLSGDLGKDHERELLSEMQGAVSLLLAGHHGSATSSGPALVAALAPRHLVYSVGRHNPFGHPAPEVVRRFRRAGACQWSTGLDGALTFRLGGETLTRPAAADRTGVRPGVDCGHLALESP
ncbi:DNA internalization-related competence protein ComEC/Rec2 [Halomonas halodenitrificans]|uniref:DNA internalization-related competence protein ComEC/Rec2 n=1 Tax=Halomonas halodenitrificans TaxID=28252 RepID=UPI0006867AD2|nr:DNA internalization-related competence protein ComEC/Rec2 [Halomonas halodenitrificans]